jgi:hypothetical protein
MDPRSTGIAIHEWLGLAIGATAIVHILLHWDWLGAITRRFFGKMAFSNRVKYILNALLFVDMTTIILSGVMMSKAVLPLFGIQLDPGFIWHTLHSLSATLAVFIVGLHLALHWKWIVSTFKRTILGPLALHRPKAQPELVKQEVKA